jgi:hypothetical protein
MLQVGCTNKRGSAILLPTPPPPHGQLPQPQRTQLAAPINTAPSWSEPLTCRELLVGIVLGFVATFLWIVTYQ